MKQSRTWITQHTQSSAWDTGDFACLDLDANGYVRSLVPRTDHPDCTEPDYNAVSTLFFYGENWHGHYPAGRYTVTWEGRGKLEYFFAARKNDADSSDHRDALDVDPSESGFMLRISEIDPEDPVRNIHVWMPGFDENTGPSQLFHPDFLRLIRRNKVLRFMDWMMTNNSNEKEFATRPKRPDVRWTEHGVPLEIMVELSNRTDTHPWFNMPHQATDDYMMRFAQMVKRQLRRDLNVYVEYSNEIWNRIFTQGTYVRDHGVGLFGAADEWESRFTWHGMRSAQMCDIWKAAFGDQADRVVCVLGGWASNAYMSRVAAECTLWTDGRPCRGHGLTAMAIAPYFGGYLGDDPYFDTVKNWNLDKLFTEITQGGQLTGGPAGGSLAEARRWMDAHADVVDDLGMHLVAYEGGQHLAGVPVAAQESQTLTRLFTSANRDARMGAIYTQYLNQWKAAGGEMMVHFNASGMYSKYGSWGAVEFLDQQNTQKQTAIRNFIQNTPCWWTGCED
ncbi:hypothetical protein [Tahibacter amnicola]|uniref:Cellulose-binding protein n=1 Tax=Tahibacter amnicola TaxID=2976241 RepID=A0ABY6BJG4_9GAMM|nr:hypothetical protein [Tahibacter amnicola]UXI70148.1 hypothetical protein N4264_11105 [Tahibacter amnicola]